MTLIMNRETVTKTGTPNRSIGRDLIGIGAIIAASADRLSPVSRQSGAFDPDHRHCAAGSVA
jgi:hypothetical protein